jgi:hypothetical protein
MYLLVKFVALKERSDNLLNLVAGSLFSARAVKGISVNICVTFSTRTVCAISIGLNTSWTTTQATIWPPS